MKINLIEQLTLNAADKMGCKNAIRFYFRLRQFDCFFFIVNFEPIYIYILDFIGRVVD